MSEKMMRMTKDVCSTEYTFKEEVKFGVNLAIPNNAVVEIHNSGTKREYFTESIEVLIGIGKDYTASLIMDLEAFEALKKNNTITFTICQ